MPRSKRPAHRFLLMIPAGTAEAVGRLLDEDVAGVDRLDDSAMLVTVREPKLPQLAYDIANNAFRVMFDVPRKSIAASLSTLAERVFETPAGIRADRKRGFRVVAHIDGQLQAVPGDARGGLQQALTMATQAPVTSRGGGDEFWVIGRRGHDRIYLAQRLRSDSSAKPPKGALSPQIAAILVALAGVRQGETVMDPFAGSGAIPLACARAGASHVYANDIVVDPKVEATMRRYRSVHWSTGDIERLVDQHAGRIDVIVTDPPWGEFEQLREPGDSLLERSVKALDAMVDPAQGRCVVLMARRGAATMAGLLKANRFAVSEQIPILVNGHPATIIIAGR